MRNLGALTLTALLAVTACGGSDDSTPAAETTAAGSESSDGTPAEESVAREAESEPESEVEPEPEPEPFDTAAAAAQLRIEIDELVFEDGSAELDKCPTGKQTTFTRLTALIPEAIHDDVGLSNAIDAQLTSSASATELPISGTVLLGCGSSADDNGAGIDIAPAPNDIEAFLREFNDPNSIGDLAYDVTPSGEHAGGEFLHVAVDTIDETEFPFNSREVIWLDDNMLVSVYAFGPAALGIDLEQIEGALQADLPAIIAIAAS